MSASNINDPTTWRLKVDSIPYRLVERSGSFGSDTSTARESYIIEASQLQNFAYAVLPETIDQGAGKLRHVGGRLLPGSDRMRTKSFTWKAFVPGLPVDPYSGDSNAPDNTYKDLVMVDIDYETSDLEEDSTTDTKTILEVSAGVAGQFLNVSSAISRGGFDVSIYRPGEGVIEELEAVSTADGMMTITKLIPETEWNVRWPHVPHDWGTNILLPTLSQYMGKVNSAAMNMPPIKSPVECLLFLGFSYSAEKLWNETKGAAELPPVKFDLKFLERQVPADDNENGIGGHNHHFRPKVGKWQKFVFDKDAEAADREFTYPKVDLNKMFAPIPIPP